MAVLSVTAANVLATVPLNGTPAVAGATITAGQPIYKDSTGKLQLSDANGVAAAQVVDGIALGGGSSGQPILYIKTDATFTPGFTSTAGVPIYLSDTPGSLTATYADVQSASSICIVVGVMLTTTTMNLNPIVGGAIA